MNFCFIGCGKVARFHGEVVRAQGHSIIAVSARRESPNIKRFMEEFGVPRGYDEWEDMLAAERPDAVVVVTPWDKTQDLAAAVIKNGTPCLVEKPVALTSDKLAQILKDSAPYHHQVLVGYNRRFYETVAPIQEALQRWPLISIQLDLPEAAGFLRESYSDSILPHIPVYLSSHWYDLLLFLVGEVSVREVYARTRAGERHVTACNGLLWSERYRIPIHLQSNCDAPSNIALCFNFEDRIYRLSPGETLTVYKGMDKHRSACGRFNRFTPKVERVVQADETYKPGFYRQMDNFANACVSKVKPNMGGCTLEESLAVTHLLEEIQLAARPY